MGVLPSIRATIYACSGLYVPRGPGVGTAQSHIYIFEAIQKPGMTRCEGRESQQASESAQRGSGGDENRGPEASQGSSLSSVQFRDIAYELSRRIRLMAPVTRPLGPAIWQRQRLTNRHRSSIERERELEALVQEGAGMTNIAHFSWGKTILLQTEEVGTSRGSMSKDSGLINQSNI